jgi:hypothetical protein
MKEVLIEKEEVEDSISVHVLSVSAAMVGVCLTVIQLIKMNGGQCQNTLVDEVLAGDSIFFLVACCVSFLALKTKRKSHRRKILENVGDFSFLIGLSTMVFAAAAVVLALI